MIARDQQFFPATFTVLHRIKRYILPDEIPFSAE